MLDGQLSEALIEKSKVPSGIRAKLDEFASMPLELMSLGISTWDAGVKIDFLSSNYLKPVQGFVKQTTATGERITEIAQYLLLLVGLFLLLFIAYVYRFFLLPIFSEMIALHEEVLKAKEQEIHFERLRVLGQISGGVAHEFNNVLNIISGNAEMAKMRSQKSAPTTKYIDKILHTSIRAASLTDQLLMYSRRRHLNEVHVSLKEFFDGIERTVLPVIGGDIDLQLGIETDAFVFVDPVFFESSVVNLITNARDALATGQGSSIEVRAEQGDFGYVRISVIDDGPGVPESQLALIREPFYSTKRIGHGTGLGLAMVEGFAGQSRGKLEIQSKPGRTVTSLILPISYPDEREILTSEPFNTPTVYLADVRVLLVEDRLDDFEFIVEHLRAAGCSVGVARSVAEAKNVQARGWDIVLCDVDLGEGSGLDVLHSFQENENCPPFVFMTGNMPNTDIRDAISRTKQRVIMKPFSMAEMVEALKGELRTSK